MDPITISALIGLGTTAAGSFMKFQGASAQADAQKNITRLEQSQDMVRRQAMEVSAHRMQLEAVRNDQRARAQAQQHATNQGAQFGSGLQGGLAQIHAQTQFNLSGIQQNLAAGRQMFDINSQISQQKIAMGDAASTMATGSGLTSLGSGITSNLGAIKSLTTGDTFANLFGSGGATGGQLS